MGVLDSPACLPATQILSLNLGQRIMGQKVDLQLLSAITTGAFTTVSEYYEYA